MSIRDHICGAHNVSLILIHFTGNAFYLLTCRICASLEVQCQSISRSSCKVGGKAWTLCVCVAQLTCHVILFLASPLLDALYVGGVGNGVVSPSGWFLCTTHAVCYVRVIHPEKCQSDLGPLDI